MKKHILLICLISIAGFSQAQQPSKTWYQEKVSKKNVGIDLKRAYADLIENNGSEIIVAVIDGGTDISHPDLKANIWRNPGEIANNGMDDDNNGYIDDTAGWNFIGGKDGRMVEFDNLEKTRLLRKLMAEFQEVDAEVINSNDARREKYEFYQKLKTEIEEQKANYQNLLNNIYKPLKKGADQIKSAFRGKDPSKEDLTKYETQDNEEIFAKSVMLRIMKSEKKTFSEAYKNIEEQYDQIYSMVNYHYSVDYDPRDIVGDNYNNAYERFYGNNDVAGPDASHGTHVAGIIGAVRGNNIGVEGVANNVKIMVVRVVPDGDERDKDVANGIRYAVDNGAKIINMSFGKGYSWNKAVVDSAVAYAVSKNVLLIHAAGNDGENNDEEPNYPNDSLPASKVAATWLEIGASGPPKSTLATDFSNYGKYNVDVFSPGYQIYSTTPKNNYESFNGTSMAAPVTAGVAALVWSQYPKLSALQVKEILMKSAVVNTKKVVKPGTKKQKVKFTELSVSGGVINAYNALKLAATY